MNILLWVLQVVLALHTVMGAVWKFSKSEKSVPSLKAIPHGVWLVLSGFELLCAVGLILPALGSSLAVAAPVGAVCIAAEMLFFTGMHMYSGDTNHGHVVYWLVVAIVCGLLVYGRLVLEPF